MEPRSLRREAGVVRAADEDLPEVVGCGVEDEVAAVGVALIARGGGEIPAVGVGGDCGIGEIDVNILRGDEAGCERGAVTAEAGVGAGVVVRGCGREPESRRAWAASDLLVTPFVPLATRETELLEEFQSVLWESLKGEVISGPPRRGAASSKPWKCLLVVGRGRRECDDCRAGAGIGVLVNIGGTGGDDESGVDDGDRLRETCRVAAGVDGCPCADDCAASADAVAGGEAGRLSE